VLTRARALFAQAHAAMAECDRRAMRPARLMSASYAALLDRLEARGWQRLAEPVRVPKWQKLWIAARHLA
jgi:phytoene synthase